MEVLQKIDTSPVEQVIAMPRPQKAEQLVEVPTIVSFSPLQRQTAEQIIEIPVPLRGGVRGEQGGFQGLSSGQNSTARIVEQNVDIPVPAGGLHDLPHPGASSSSAVSRDERGQGFFFRTFPRKKKVRSPSQFRVRSCPPRAACAGVQVADEYFEYNGSLCKRAWDQGNQCYCWCFVDPRNGYCFEPVWQPPWELIPSRAQSLGATPGTWSWPCGPCTRWRASS